MTGIILIWACIAFSCVIFGIALTFSDVFDSDKKLSATFCFVSFLLLCACILLLCGSYHGIDSATSAISTQQGV